MMIKAVSNIKLIYGKVVAKYGKSKCEREEWHTLIFLRSEPLILTKNLNKISLFL